MKNKIKLIKILFLFFWLISASLLPLSADARGEAKLSLSPLTGSFMVGSTFDVSIVLNTDEVYANTVKVDLKFPADLLQVVTPSSGKSFVSLWLEQPTYSNTEELLVSLAVNQTV